MEIKLAGALGALISLSIILLLQTSLVQVARKKANKTQAGRVVHFMDLVVTCEDESYSLSRLQMYIWTVAIVTGFCAVFVAIPGIPNIPDTLYMLVGVNFANAVASTAINTYKTTPPQAPPPAQVLQDQVQQPMILQQQPLQQAVPAQPPKSTPNFVQDIFFESPDSLDLPRTQMFIWTLVSLGVFVVSVVSSFSSTPKLPDIGLGLVALMGISNGAYLGAKAAKNNNTSCA
jgi:hypothetical protein